MTLNLVAFISLADIGSSLREAFFMFWETLWALVLGFTLSGAVQAFVSRDEMQRVMGDHRPKAVVRARIINSPRHMKRFLLALQENVAKYESQFGRIEIGPTPDLRSSTPPGLRHGASPWASALPPPKFAAGRVWECRCLRRASGASSGSYETSLR